MQIQESTRLDNSFASLLRSRDFFTPSLPVWTARAPGRLDFMGGNVDYTGGLVLQRPIREGVYAAFQQADRPTLRVLNPDASRFSWQPELEFPVHGLADLQTIQAACPSGSAGGWGRYVLGAFALLQERYGAFQQAGGNLFLASDLPPNRGLASSAALTIAVLKAATAASRIPLQGVALAEAGQWVENIVAHSACGIMDHAAIVLGQQDALLPIFCQPCQPLPPLHLPKYVRIWGIDSGMSRSTDSPAYDAARAAAFMGYRMICEWEELPLERETVPDSSLHWREPRWKGYLSNLSVSEFRARYDHRLPVSMYGGEFSARYPEHMDPLTKVHPETGYPVRAAVRYACEEHFRIQTAHRILRSLDTTDIEDSLHLVGELIFQSHHAYRECGLGAAACDDLVARAKHHGFLGAKMTGGGSGGVVAVLGTTKQEEELKRLAESFATAQGIQPAIFSGSSHGGDRSGTRSIVLPQTAEAVP